MAVLPPGTILQHFHFRRRLAERARGGSFYDVGAGGGCQLSRLLLARNMTGEAFDLNAEACAENEGLNQAAIAAGRYRVRHESFMEAAGLAPAALIVCALVVEHWEEREVDAFLTRARSLLTADGILCLFVPGSPRHWGIEDEIAGHRRRYTRDDLRGLAQKSNLVIRDLRGLTYPLSNLLLPLSNRLVSRVEKRRLDLSLEARTIASGHRQVPYKTSFPSWMGLLANQAVLRPFDLLQRLARDHADSLVLYCEFGRTPD